MAGFIFDLDGTLVDSVYQHVLAWQNALRACGLSLSVWRIHRRVGMSGGLMARSLVRELGFDVRPDLADELRKRHMEEFAKLASQVVPLPGARELLSELTRSKIPWAIATSGALESAKPTLAMLDVPEGTPIITRDRVKRAKPDPDLFIAAAKELGEAGPRSWVVGDSVWDMLAARRGNFLGVGVLCGGYGEEELNQAGAYRVYADPADMLLHLDELGVRDE